MPMPRTSRTAVVVMLLAAAMASGQTPPRRAANVTALLSFPAFYHGRQIVVVGDVTTDREGHATVSDGAMSVRLVFKGSAPDGPNEIRGEFWDVGRMKPDEPRLNTIDLRATFG